MEVSQTFVANLMAVQKQLDASYRDDKALRERLMTAVDLPSIQVSLKVRTRRTAQQLANRIANRPSDKRKAAGAYSAHFTQSQDIVYYKDAFYTLVQKYGGAAGRALEPFGNREPTRRPSGGQQKSRHKTLHLT